MRSKVAGIFTASNGSCYEFSGADQRALKELEKQLTAAPDQLPEGSNRKNQSQRISQAYGSLTPRVRAAFLGLESATKTGNETALLLKNDPNFATKLSEFQGKNRLLHQHREQNQKAKTAPGSKKSEGNFRFFKKNSLMNLP